MSAVTQIARALADDTRLHILMLLVQGEASVSDLVTRLDLPQPRVSTHLALLRQAGLVSVALAGRQRVYTVDAERIQTAINALQALTPSSPRRSPQASREVQRNTALRQARTCYDHLAGVAGVHLLDRLLASGWLEPMRQEDTPRPLYRLTPQGEDALRARHVGLVAAGKGRRRFAYGCLDWTERRVHLGGALGAAIFVALHRAGVLRQQAGTRAVVLDQALDPWMDGTFSTLQPCPHDADQPLQHSL